MDRMTKEAIRYLGYGRNAVDEQTLALIKDSFEGLRSAVSPKSICRFFDFTASERGVLSDWKYPDEEQKSGQKF